METQVTAPQEILTHLSEVTEALVKELNELTTEEVDFDPGPGEWSVKQILAHLQDSEKVFNERLHLMLTENEPYLEAFNPDELAEQHDYASLVWAELIKDFEETRRANITLLTNLQPNQWYKAGVHQERGHISVRDATENLITHTEGHLEQITHVGWLAK